MTKSPTKRAATKAKRIHQRVAALPPKKAKKKKGGRYNISMETALHDDGTVLAKSRKKSFSSLLAFLLRRELDRAKEPSQLVVITPQMKY